ncbi:MAG: recombinase family protein, partial [Propionibacteriales bacterium]|nr:recombinase family protein [Propionibacteriales bacterium]
ASSGTRPAYQRMLADIRAGHIDAVVVWDLDRLHRRPIELEEFITLADSKGLALGTVTGDVDLGTDNGRLFARIKGAVARAEMERKSARQKASHEQRRSTGRQWSSSRPFGFQSDLVTHHPVEAEALRQAYADFLAGVGLREICRRLDAQGIKSAKGNRLIHTTLRNLLRHKRNAGFLPDGTRGAWEPIVDEQTWRTALARLDERSAPGRLPVGLLSGYGRCGVCDGHLGRVSANGKPAYACYGHKPDGSLRKCVTRSAHYVDALVIDMVLERLSRDDAVELLTADSQPVDRSAEAATLRSRLEEMASAYADGAFTMREWRTARDRVSAKLAEVEALMVADSSRLALAPIAGSDDVPGVWAGMDIGQQRAVVQTLVAVTIMPTKRGARFIPEDVRVEWLA